MTGSSSAVANLFLELANDQGRTLDQMQLQELVYIAHGWCLALAGKALTFDRPVAMAYGHEYGELAAALAACGSSPVTQAIGADASAKGREEPPACFDDIERRLIASILSEYGGLSAVQMAVLTKGPGSPWEQVYANGSGMNLSLPDDLIKAQFLALSEVSSSIGKQSD